MPEAPLERTDHGTFPYGEGWFVVNAHDAQWFDSDGLGLYAPFEGENATFGEIGVNLVVLRPGEPSGMYHSEEAQEDFLVLSGACLLLVEGQERQLKAWDFVHCPPWTEHIFVGAGDAPCLILAVGARGEGRGLRYPVDDVALRHRAGVTDETTSPKEAYARFDKPKPVPCPPEFPG